MYQSRRKRPTYLNGFWAHYVDKTSSPSGCWLWLGKPSNAGYGQLTVMGRTITAHRYSYEQEYGSIPDGMDLDHACETKLCIRPDHLEPVTKKVNLERAREARGGPKSRTRLRESPAAELVRRLYSGEDVDVLLENFVIGRRRR